MLSPTRPGWPRQLSDKALSTGWAALAIVAGLAVMRLPVLTAVEALAGLAALLLSLFEPAIGLGLALALGVTRAYLQAALPALPDLGQVFLGLALAGWLARCLAQRRIQIPPSGILVAFSLYLGASLLSLVPNPQASLELGGTELIKWAEMAAILVLVVAEARRGRATWLVVAIIVAGVAEALIGIWQYRFRGHGPENFLIFGTYYRAYGTFEQPNPFAGFLGLTWPVAAGLALAYFGRAWRTRRAWPAVAAGGLALATGLMLGALYVSFSRGAWLGAAAAALGMAATLPRRIWLGVTLVSLSLAAGWALAVNGLLPASLTARLAQIGDFTAATNVTGVDITSDNFAIVERLAHWQAAEGMARDYPWLGVGVGNYETAYPNYALLNWPLALGHAHMIYLNVLAETGLVGLAAYGILWAAVIGLTVRTISRTSGVARGLALGLLGAWLHLGAHQIVDDLYVNNIPLTIGVMLGLLVVLSRLPRGAAEDSLDLEIPATYDD